MKAYATHMLNLFPECCTAPGFAGPGHISHNAQHGNVHAHSQDQVVKPDSCAAYMLKQSPSIVIDL